MTEEAFNQIKEGLQEALDLSKAGAINSTPLIEECAMEMCSHDIQAKPGSPLFAIHWEEYGSGYRFNAEKIIGVLRKRGLINTQGLEILQREMPSEGGRTE